MKRILMIAAAGLVLAACARTPEPVEWTVTETALPAGPGALAPNLYATADGGVLLSWLEPVDSGGHALRFARRAADGTWSEPRTIAAGDDWFVNWADFPALVELTDGTLVAHWLQKSGAATYAYDVMVVHSQDGGASWSEPFRPHEDGTQTEHGFVSLLPLPDGAAQVVWLDGRQTQGGGHSAHHHGASDSSGPMTLRTRRLGPGGVWGEEELLDLSVCDCCQTAAVHTARGVTVAYRGRTGDEIRDIWLTSQRDGAWTLPRMLADEGWHLTGCPVNGPMLATNGEIVSAAWFTAAGEAPRVYAAFSGDGGDTFGEPLLVDAGAPLGRVATVMLDDGTALVSWLAAVADGDAEIRIRRVGESADPAFVVARSAAARGSGFPRLARAGDAVLVAWTEPGSPGGLRGALIRPSGR
ncbi:MAG: glycoside hydrolase [Xanthomonadaceae bacterium]|nr:glycoside hydrolase [Xanthomonadaceae bacterium]